MITNNLYFSHIASYVPRGPVDDLFPGTWYLTRVDEKHRREYARSPLDCDLQAEPELVRSSMNTEVQETQPAQETL